MGENYPTLGPMVDPTRGDRPHQIVKVRNTAEKQSHVVFDRNGRGITLEPGQTKDIDMLLEEVAHFQHERKPGRIREMMVQKGNVFTFEDTEAPPHPISIEGIPDIDIQAKPNNKQQPQKS